MLPTVGVVIPCYNYARYLRGCVASVLSQEGVDVSILIIDDCSSDDSYAVAMQLAAEDPRIRVIRHEVNRGHILTYNEGLAQITAKYSVLLSADDLLTPGALGRATALMEAHPSVGLVYGHPLVFRDDVLPRARTHGGTWSIWAGSQWLELMCRAGHNFIYCPEVVMRTSVQKRIGFYNPQLPHSGDMEMWMRAACVADIGRVGGVDQAYYRVHRLSMQRTVHTGLLTDFKGRLAAFESVLASGPDRPHDAARLLAMACHALGREALAQARAAATNPDVPPAEVDTYLQLAEQLLGLAGDGHRWPQLVRSVRRRRGRLARLYSGLRDDVMGRVRWRYWRWTGVHRFT